MLKTTSVRQKRNIYTLILIFTTGLNICSYFITADHHEVQVQYTVAAALSAMFCYLIMEISELACDIVLVLFASVGISLIAIFGDDSAVILGGWAQLIPITMLMITQKDWSLFVSSFVSILLVPFQESTLIAATSILQKSGNRHVMLAKSFFSIVLQSTLFYILYKSQQKQERVALEEKRNAEISASQLKSFIQSFSHELRNPLNSLKGSLDLALAENFVPPKVVEFLNTSKTCTHVLLQLINNILDSGKAENGTLEVDPQPCDLRQILLQTWTIFSGIIKNKGLNGYVQLQNTLPSQIKIDPVRINQVIMNLLSNAVKFTRRGQIIMEIDWLPDETEIKDDHFIPKIYGSSLYSVNSGSTQSINEIPSEVGINQAQIKRNIKQSGTWGEYDIISFSKKEFSHKPRDPSNSQFGVLRITVSDTGMGMKKSDLSRLFTKFAQFSNDSNSRQMGTGLGLNIAKQIVEKSGGDIKASSKYEHGTSFIVCIPTVFMAGYTQNTKYDMSKVIKFLSPKKLKFMIADDSSENIYILKNFIGKIGGEVISAHYDGKSCLDAYVDIMSTAGKNMESQADYLITDLEMPLLDGIQLAKKIKSIERESRMSKIKIIMISGNDIEEKQKEELTDNNTILKFIKKPYTFEEFAKAIFAISARSMSASPCF